MQNNWYDSLNEYIRLRYNTMNLEELQNKIKKIVEKYRVKKVVLFGSRADGTFHENSDIDLIIEFDGPVSLLTLSKIKLQLEESIGLSVDIVHGPL